MKTILIVDDSKIIRTLVRKQAEEIGIEVIAEAGNGRDAIRLYREFSPSMVTLDLTMPDVDGLQALNEIMVIDPNAKILIITAVSNQAVSISALEKGAAGFLQKPFAMPDLRKALEELA